MSVVLSVVVKVDPMVVRWELVMVVTSVVETAELWVVPSVVSMVAMKVV